MTSPVRRDARRFRRRILTIGGVVFGVSFVVGAPIYLDRVESDLERRVPRELAAAGHAGITAAFDGQDGTLTCEAPLADPEDARQAAYDVWGVRAIELDRSCRVKGSDGMATADEPAVTTAPTTATADTEASTATTVAPDPSTETTRSTPSTTQPLDFETVASAVSGSPQLTLLTVLLQEAGLTASLSDPAGEPVTLFAPTDEAFESLPADVLASMRADPEQLALVLRHHLVDGAVPSTQLASGPIEALEGGPLEVTVSADGGDPGIVVAGAPISVPDLMTGNGVVHVVDGVLVPEALAAGQPQPEASVNAALDGNVIVLSGVVASEAVRAILVEAAGASVTDSLTVDPDVGLDTTTAQALATLIAAMPDNLVDGDAGFDGDGVYLAGTYRTDAGRDAVAAVAASVEALVQLEPAPEATTQDAVDLEAQLNEFVAGNPILFPPGSATPSAGAVPILDQLAALALQFDGVAIVVEGHTDSDGDPERNLELSRMRAFAVQQALIERGLPEDAVTFEGFGSQQPILVDGVEDKQASRRVEFRVETT